MRDNWKNTYTMILSFARDVNRFREQNFRKQPENSYRVGQYDIVGASVSTPDQDPLFDAICGPGDQQLKEAGVGLYTKLPDDVSTYPCTKCGENVYIRGQGQALKKRRPEVPVICAPCLGLELVLAPKGTN